MEVPFYKPHLPPYEKVEKEFRDSYERGMLAPSRYTYRLENKLQEYLNVKHVVAFSNCSDAMMCLVGYLGDLTGKKKVIIPGFTFAATWQAVDWNGMEAVVADTDESGLIDVDHVKRLLTKHGQDVAAILAVHMFGHPPDIEFLQELALKYKTYLIFDAAHGMGTLYNGQRLGNSGLAEVFSIGTTKTLAAGEGGILTTNDSQLAEAMRMAAMHGHKQGELDVEVKSLNGRIQEINSIIAYHGLEELDDSINQRIKSAMYYNKHLKNVPRLRLWSRDIDVRPSYKDYTIFLDSPQVPTKELCSFRDRVVEKLAIRQVPTKRYYYPAVPDLFCFKGVECGFDTYPVCRRLSAGCISLPFFTGITEEQQNYVIETLKKVLNEIHPVHTSRPQI